MNQSTAELEATAQEQESTVEAPLRMPPAGQLLLDAAEVAALLGIGRTLWLTMVAAGKTPAPVRLGRRVMWRRNEIESWIACGCPAKNTWQLMKKQ